MNIPSSNPTWTWPEELDALTADPLHHKLLFENDRVRVLDTCIPPGETTNVHTHKWPATLYFISWSDFIRYDKDGDVMLDSRSLAVKPAEGSSSWTDAFIPHSLKNIGQTDLRVISVEIKRRE